MAVVVDPKKLGSAKQDSILLVNSPDWISHNTELQVDYSCYGNKRVVVEVRYSTDLQRNRRAFARSWPCFSKGHPRMKLQRTIEVHLPPQLAFRPTAYFPRSIAVNSVSIRVFIIDVTLYEQSPSFALYSQSVTKAEYRTRFLEPFQRPAAPTQKCYSWWRNVLLSFPFAPLCPSEPGAILNLV